MLLLVAALALSRPPTLANWNEFNLQGAPFTLDAPFQPIVPKEAPKVPPTYSDYKMWEWELGEAKFRVEYSKYRNAADVKPAETVLKEAFGSKADPVYGDKFTINPIEILGRNGAESILEQVGKDGKFITRCWVRVNGLEEWAWQVYHRDHEVQNANAEHFFRSIVPVRPKAPELQENNLGALSLLAPGKLNQQKHTLTDSEKKLISEKTTYLSRLSDGTHIEVYHYVMHPGRKPNAAGVNKALTDWVEADSKEKTRIVTSLDKPYATGVESHNTAFSKDGPILFRTASFTTKPNELWAIVMKAPNFARYTKMLATMAKSIKVDGQTIGIDR
jgi:hypothetical protein